MQRGFSLVELSIVLVILGLLTGGILAGQSLIRASELRAVSTEYGRYVTAVSSFRDKYFALPGDMANAASFWGAADGSTGNTAACLTTASTSATTCNGNGDGSIRASTAAEESYRFWQHLANAGLIEGRYTGARDGTLTYATTANNAPRSKLNQGLWFVYDYQTITGNGGFFDGTGTYRNVMEMGGAVANDQPVAYIVKPEEMWNIDTKMDDGKPGTGKLVVRCQSGIVICTTTSTTTNYSADYLLSSSALAATFVFRNNF